MPPLGGPQEDPGHAERDYVSLLARAPLRITLKKLDEVPGEREVWTSLLRLLPPRPGPR